MSAAFADLRRRSSICHALRQENRDYQTCNPWFDFRPYALGRIGTKVAWCERQAFD